MRAHVPSGIAGPMTIGRLIPARYTSAGSYTITVTASDPYGHAISANSTVEVAISAAPPPLVDNMFSVYCSGAFCGDVDAGTYSGQDAGIWRYHNSTSQTASVDVAIAGVSEGDLATLVFSNGQPLAAPEIPAVGTLVTGMTQSLRAPAAKFSPRAALSSTATSDMQILSRNQALARRLLAMRRAQSKLRARFVPLRVWPPDQLHRLLGRCGFGARTSIHPCRTQCRLAQPARWWTVAIW